MWVCFTIDGAGHNTATIRHGKNPYLLLAASQFYCFIFPQKGACPPERLQADVTLLWYQTAGARAANVKPSAHAGTNRAGAQLGQRQW